MRSKRELYVAGKDGDQVFVELRAQSFGRSHVKEGAAGGERSCVFVHIHLAASTGVRDRIAAHASEIAPVFDTLSAVFARIRIAAWLATNFHTVIITAAEFKLDLLARYHSTLQAAYVCTCE